MIIVKCRHCGKLSKALAANDGRKGRCPHCNKIVPIKPAAELPPTTETTSCTVLPVCEPAGLQKKCAPPDTQASIVLSAVVGLGLTYLFYVGLVPMLPDSVVTLVARRGDVPYAEMYSAFWLVSILIIKAIKSGRQSVWMRRCAVPMESGQDSPQAASSIENNERLGQRSIFVSRVVMALRHYRVVRDMGEVRNALLARSAIDANTLDASYVIPQVLIWAIPILGFVGTVYGISFAITQFSDLLPSLGESAKEATAIRDALSKVTQGLAIAFDTTLLALCLVLPLMLLTTWLKKSEEAFLQRLDGFSNEELTKWLHKHGDALLSAPVESASNSKC